MSVAATDGVAPQERALPESPEAPEAGVWRSVAGLTEAVLDRCGGLVRIIALEGRLAGLSLAYMLLLAVLSAVLLVSAWLMFNATFGIWLSGSGWSLPGVMFLLGVINLVAAGGAAVALRKFSNNLLFTGSRTQLFARHYDETPDAEA